MISTVLCNQGVICAECCSKVDDFYEFREQCLQNSLIFLNKTTQLSSDSDSSGELYIDSDSKNEETKSLEVLEKFSNNSCIMKTDCDMRLDDTRGIDIIKTESDIKIEYEYEISEEDHRAELENGIKVEVTDDDYCGNTNIEEIYMSETVDTSKFENESEHAEIRDGATDEVYHDNSDTEKIVIKYEPGDTSEYEGDELKSANIGNTDGSSMNTQSSENDIQHTRPVILHSSGATSLDTLPQKSRRNYEVVYKAFIDWQLRNNITSFSEDTLLAYFKKLTKKYKSTTLWCHYSMLKCTLNIKHNIDMEPYSKVRAVLKRHSEGYQPKKSVGFTGEEINKFINEAPDMKYLATKVALIMGVMGACRASELYSMKFEDLIFFEDYIQVLVPHTKAKVPRNFTVTNRFFHIVKKYAELRPPNALSNSFFLNFQKGKCTKQTIGINKFGAMGREIANFLGITNPERYTGHCFRKSFYNS